MAENFEAIADRMLYAGRLKNLSAIARALNVTPQALSNYKKRGQMPTDLAVRFAQTYKISIDWLLTGEGPSPDGPRIDLSSPAQAPIIDLSPDEMVFVGKALKVLRSSEPPLSMAFRRMVEGFSQVNAEVGA